MEFNLENPFTNLTHEIEDTHDHTDVASLFVVEVDHMPSYEYAKTLILHDFDVHGVRRQTISMISQFCRKFDPILSYLAVNYLDRFLSSQALPNMKPKPWVLRVVAISCVALAAKMHETEFSPSEFQGEESGLIYDSHTIKRMELLILGALKWRMRSITPFTFLAFFISLFKLEDPVLIQSLKTLARDIIFKAQDDVKFLKFKPSVIAASAALVASRDLLAVRFPTFKKEISECSYVNKDNVLRCYEALLEVSKEGLESSSYTPKNVLDHNMSSSDSEKTSTTISTVRSERVLKKRKINGYCITHTVQISQFQ